MSIWLQILYRIGLRKEPGPRYYELTDSLHIELEALSKSDGRPEHELAQELISAGLLQYHSHDERYRKWDTLSKREQEIAALASLGLSNYEIAERLSIEYSTVKTHMLSIFKKFGIHSRYELSDLLSSKTQIQSK